MMKICFIGNLSSPFIKRDYEILNKYFNIEIIELPKKKKEWMKYPFLVKRKVKQTDGVFGWFAGWHTLPPVYYSKKYKRKAIIVAGGYDVVYLPEINYGAFTKIKEKIPARYVLEKADLVISISKSNQKELLRKITPKRNILIYNGVPIDHFYPEGKKEKIVLTIGSVNPSNWQRKGLHQFVEVAQYFTLKGWNDTKFVVVGKIADDMNKKIDNICRKITNITFTGLVSDEDLLKWCQKAKVYLQLSAHEGFGLSVAEAMLCECVPVVSDRFALPEVVGDAGFIVPYNDLKTTAKVVKKTLDDTDELGKKARERVKEKFSLEKREKALVKIIRKYLREVK